MAGAVKAFNPDLVGFTATTCTYPRAVQLMKIIRPMGFRTIIGGVHVSTLPEKALDDGFDMVVAGEGERMLLEIIRKGHTTGIFRVPREMIFKKRRNSFAGSVADQHGILLHGQRAVSP